MCPSIEVSEEQKHVAAVIDALLGQYGRENVLAELGVRGLTISVQHESQLVSGTLLDFIDFCHEELATADWKGDSTLKSHHYDILAFKEFARERNLLDLPVAETWDGLRLREFMKTRKTRDGQPIANATWNRKLALLRTMHKLGVDTEYLTGGFPTTAVDWETVRTNNDRALSPRTLSAVFERLLDTKNGMRNYMIALAMAFTAARIGDVLSLKINEIAWDRNKATVFGKHARKGRPVYVLDPFKSMLRQYIVERYGRLAVTENTPVTAYVFPNRIGDGHMDERSVQRIFRDVREQLKHLPDAELISPHSIRHTFATMFAERSGNFEILRRILGHTSVQMSLRYVTTNEEKIIESLRSVYADMEVPGVDD